MTSTSDECCTLKLSPSSHLTLMTALCLVNSLSLTHTHPLQFLCFSSILWKLFLGLHSIFVLHLTFNYGFPQGLCHLHFLPTPPRWVHLYPQFQLPLVYQWLIKPSPAFIQLSYPSPKAEIFSISSHLPHRCRDITLPKKVRLVKAIGEGNGTPLQYSCLENPMDRGAWWAAVHGVTKSRTWLNNFTFTFHFHALEKEMATHSSVLAQRIPGMGEPGGLLSMGSHRVGHDWSDLAAAAVC